MFIFAKNELKTMVEIVKNIKIYPNGIAELDLQHPKGFFFE